MTSILKSILLATFVITLPSVKALADVTSQQVWDGLRTAMVASGFKLRASETRNGTRLTIGDLQINKRFQDPGVTRPEPSVSRFQVCNFWIRAMARLTLFFLKKYRLFCAAIALTMVRLRCN